MANYLYNGIEQPDINTVWTDKDTYPYAYMGSSYSDGSTILVVTKYEKQAYQDGRVLVMSANIIGGNDVVFALKDGLWSEMPVSGYQVYAYWSSSDLYYLSTIETIGGTLYLSATTPISLANQTVIEWDGDTTDLESTTRTFTASENTETLTFYKVSSVVPSVKQVEGGYYVAYYYNAGTRYDGKNINYLTSDGFVVSGGTDDTFCNPFVLVNSEGVWLNKAVYADNADGDHYTSIFTYLTAAPDIDPVAWWTGYRLGQIARGHLRK